MAGFLLFVLLLTTPFPGVQTVAKPKVVISAPTPLKIEALQVSKQTIKAPEPSSNIGGTTPMSSIEVEDAVKAVFGQNSIMVKVANCESQFTQFNSDGSVHRGVQNHQDVGVMQINEHYHLAASEKLGYNIYTLAGNLAYAKLLYDQEGTTPWDWSKPCWGK